MQELIADEGHADVVPATPSPRPKRGKTAYDTPDELKREYGNRMRVARELAGLSLTHAAEALGYSQPVQLSLMETGARYPTLDVVVSLARMYGTTADYLCGLASEPERDPAVLAHRQIAAHVAAEVHRSISAATAAAVQAVREVRPAERRVEALARLIVEVGLTFGRLRRANVQFDDMRHGATLARQLQDLERAAEGELAEGLRARRRQRAKEAADLVDQPVLADLNVERALQPCRVHAVGSTQETDDVAQSVA